MKNPIILLNFELKVYFIKFTKEILTEKLLKEIFNDNKMSLVLASTDLIQVAESVNLIDYFLLRTFSSRKCQIKEISEMSNGFFSRK